MLRCDIWCDSRRKLRAATENQSSAPYNLGGPGRARIQPGSEPSNAQLCSEAHVGRFDDDLAWIAAVTSKSFTSAETSCSRATLVGALVQFDWMHDSSDALNGEVDGRGWGVACR